MDYNKIVYAHDVIEAAEVNCESPDFIRKLRDYLLDADSVDIDEIKTKNK